MLKVEARSRLGQNVVREIPFEVVSPVDAGKAQLKRLAGRAPLKLRLQLRQDQFVARAVST